MRNARRVVQILALGFFVFLIVTTVKPLNRSVPHQLFLGIDPLIAITAMLASRTFMALAAVAGVMLVVTALLGRVFCGWVCPLGTMLDIFNKLFLRRRKYGAVSAAWPAKVKYVLLVVLLVLAALGVQAAGWFDPICLATRTCAMVLYPLADRALDVGTDPIESIHTRLQESGYFLRQVPNVYALMVLNGFIFATVLGFEVAQRRFWCRNLCPLGALLGLVGRWNVLPVRVGEGCSRCDNCRRACPTGAIGDCKVSPAECIQCFTCTAKKVCANGSISHGFGLPLRKGKGEVLAVAPSRRAFVLSVLGGLVAAPLLWKGFKQVERSTPVIRPPGGQDEEDFLARCIRCGECMKICPNNAIHPCFLEAGIRGFMTPRLVPRVGWCLLICAESKTGDPDEKPNNLCAMVCPTGALRRLTRTDKEFQALGTAYVNRSKCIPWTRGEDCGMCVDACPVGAIDYLEDANHDGAATRKSGGRRPRRPVVDPLTCIGCGKCEYVCPVEGAAAVRVDRVQT